MGCHGKHAFKHHQNKFFAGTFLGGHVWGLNEQLDTHENLSWGNKVGQIRSNRVYFPVISEFFLIFVQKNHTQKYHFPLECF